VQQQEKDTAALDFLFSHNNLTLMLSSIPLDVLAQSQSTITGDVLPSIQTALQNVVSCGPYNITSQLSGCKVAVDPRTFTSCITAWTDPAFLNTWGTFPHPTVPTSALTRFIYTVGYYANGRYPDVYVVPKGVVLSPSMTPIDIMNQLAAGGSTKLQCELRNMQYYFGEYHKLAISC
jgi:hypothetical protein